MNVGSVKETDRRSFDLITPYRVFRFVNAVLYKSLLFTQKMPKTYLYWMGFYNLPASNITVASINSLVHIFTKVWQCFHVFGAVILGDALTHLVDNSPSSAQKVKQTKVCHFVWEDGGWGGVQVCTSVLVLWLTDAVQRLSMTGWGTVKRLECLFRCRVLTVWNNV